MKTKVGTINVKPFGVVNGAELDLITLSNVNGIQVSITNYVRIITSILTTDSKG